MSGGTTVPGDRWRVDRTAQRLRPRRADLSAVLTECAGTTGEVASWVGGGTLPPLYPPEIKGLFVTCGHYRNDRVLALVSHKIGAT